MLNSNDMARVVGQIAKDARKRDMHDIVSGMTHEARESFVNGYRCLGEISHQIEREELDIVARMVA